MDVFLEIKYFNYGTVICTDDFKNRDKITYLNPNLISEVSELSSYILGGEKYFTILMSNKNCYYCRESEFEKVKKRIM